MRTSSKSSYFLAGSLNLMLRCPQVALFPQMPVSNLTKLPTSNFKSKATATMATARCDWSAFHPLLRAEYFYKQTICAPDG